MTEQETNEKIKKVLDEAIRWRPYYFIDRGIIYESDLDNIADALIAANIGDVSELKAENAALREKLEDVKVFALKMKSGEIDMTIGSDVFNFITSILVQMLAQNNAENFLTTAIEVDAQEYSITVQRHAGKTPAEEISELKAENAELRARLEEYPKAAMEDKQ